MSTTDIMRDTLNNEMNLMDLFQKGGTILFIVLLAIIAIIIAKKICNKIAEEKEEEEGEEETTPQDKKETPTSPNYVGYEQLASHIKTYSVTTVSSQGGDNDVPVVNTEQIKKKKKETIDKFSSTPGQTGKKKTNSKSSTPAPDNDNDKNKKSKSDVGGKADVDDDIFANELPGC